MHCVWFALSKKKWLWISFLAFVWGFFFSSPGVPKGKGLFGITLCVIYGLSVSFPEKEIVVDTNSEIRIKLSAS